MAKRRERVLVLPARQDHNRYGWDDYGHCNLTFCERDDDGRWINAGHGFGDASWKDLTIVSQWDIRGLDREPRWSGKVYGYGIEYREKFSFDLREMEAGLKLLRRVERGLRKLEAEYGYAETFLAYVRRVAKVLGIKGAIQWDKTEDRYRELTLEEMDWAISAMVQASKPADQAEGVA